eukprot:gnl/TRDRNA2_/TRDRNA2_174678_c0_seq1.p1 gnl/TRDRNA2_/TRDRNA2_174678_c0~~gnl/TRDRNA2_/TRDRNA2_174678_c0_seq1.p1  ORF type:complete len:129 (-),score=2.00 gnl/TRDRNA2_/TRDRNA2_174678_c0_seq1:273-659(-)
MPFRDGCCSEQSDNAAALCMKCLYQVFIDKWSYATPTICDDERLMLCALSYEASIQREQNGLGRIQKELRSIYRDPSPQGAVHTTHASWARDSTVLGLENLPYSMSIFWLDIRFPSHKVIRGPFLNRR